MSKPDADELQPWVGSSGADPDDTHVEMVRSEEELRVGLRRQASGRVRLRKVIVTEEVTETFTLSHEELRIEREAMSEGGDQPGGRDLHEEEFCLTLFEERLVVGKETVARERVRLVTEIVEGEETIYETVRSEQIEVEESS